MGVTGVGVAVVMVVCVGFVILLIVLGVMRVRSAQRYKGKDQGERNGNWDNTSLTITVNPMDPDVSATCSTDKSSRVFPKIFYMASRTIF